MAANANRAGASGDRHLQTLLTAGAVGQGDDADLLARFGDGLGRADEGAELAFGVLVDRHGPLVLRVARTILGDEASSLDAFQGTFLILARKARSLRVDRSLAPWLASVARRVALGTRKAQARRLRHEQRAARPEAIPPSPPGEVWTETIRAIVAEVDRLPEPYRSAVVACHLDGLTQQAAAQSLGWPIGTLQSRLDRGRRKLRDRLTRQGLAPTGLALLPTTGLVAPLPASLATTTARAAALWAIRSSAASPFLIAPGVLAILPTSKGTGMTKLAAAFALALTAALGLSATGFLFRAHAPSVGPPKLIPPQAQPTRTAKGDAPKNENLEQVWTVKSSGPGHTITTDPKGRTVFMFEVKGECHVLDPDGKTIRTFPLEMATGVTTARVAHQASGLEGFFAFQSPARSINALNDDGTRFWEKFGSLGIDDIWAADLNGDGADEAIVGFNGFTGLHLLSSEGKLIWKRTDIGNVWSVTAGDIDGDGKLEVLSTSSLGKVHVTDANDGRRLITFDAGIYAHNVRVAIGRAKSPLKGDLLLVSGSELGTKIEAVVALGGNGRVHWTTKLPPAFAGHLSLTVSPDGTLAALAYQSGMVCVVDVESGRVLGQLVDQGFNPGVAWIVRGEIAENRLIVAAQDGVNAYRVKPTAPITENDR